MKVKTNNFKTECVRVVGLLASAGLLAMIGWAVAPASVEHVNAVVGTATASTLTFTSTRDTASVNVKVTSADGTFATSDEDQVAAFSISTNNASGYTLKLTASGDNTALSDGDNAIETIAASTTYDTFSGTGAASIALNNSWGYIPNYYYENSVNVANSTDCSTTNCYYFKAPTSSSAVTLRVTSGANSSNGIDNADRYTIGLGLRADSTNPAGTYTNAAFVLQYVANLVTYDIGFIDTTSEGTGLPSAMSGATGETSVTLPAGAPTRDGYTFAGWCLGTANAESTSCTGTLFNAGATFGIDLTADNTTTLYAIWADASAQGTNSAPRKAQVKAAAPVTNVDVPANGDVTGELTGEDDMANVVNGDGFDSGSVKPVGDTDAATTDDVGANDVANGDLASDATASTSGEGGVSVPDSGLDAAGDSDSGTDAFDVSDTPNTIGGSEDPGVSNTTSGPDNSDTKDENTLANSDDDNLNSTEEDKGSKADNLGD